MSHRSRIYYRRNQQHSKDSNLPSLFGHPYDLHIIGVIRAFWNTRNMTQATLNHVVYLYASQTGNTESIAKHLHDESLKRGFSSLLVVADDYQSVPWTEPLLLVLLTSTTGDGDHPDNSNRFWKWLRRGKPPPALSVFKGLPYTILGLGDTNYTNFCQPAKRLDRKLTELGAKCIQAKALADDAVGLESVVDPWIGQLWTTLKSFVKQDASQALLYGSQQIQSVSLAYSADVSSNARSSLSASFNALDLDPSNKNAFDECYKHHLIVVGTLPATIDDPDFASTLAGLAKPPLQFISLNERQGDTRNREAANIFNLLPKDSEPTGVTENIPIRALLEQSLTPAVSSVDTFETPPFRFTANSPFPAQIVNARVITGSRCQEAVLEVELDIDGLGGWNFRAGDAFGIIPSNPIELVDGLLIRLGLDGTQIIDITPSLHGAQSNSCLPFKTCCPSTYYEILTFFLDLHSIPKRSFFRLLADHTTTTHEKHILLFLASTDGSAAFKALREQRPNLSDILASFPSCRPPFQSLMENLPRLQPRYYSVACAPWRLRPECPKQTVKFAFNVVEYKINISDTSKPVKGVCSNWLNRILGGSSSTGIRVPPNLFVPFFPRQSFGFCLDEDVVDDPGVPILLIAAGTGITPFMGFLETLSLSSSTTQRSVWLIHGHRYGGGKTGDALYADEIDLYLKKKVLTRYTECLSRDSGQYKYIHDAILDLKQDVWKVLNDSKGIVYVCGSMSVGKAVNEALAGVVRGCFEGVDGDVGALRYLSEKSKERRYLRDVWG